MRVLIPIMLAAIMLPGCRSATKEIGKAANEIRDASSEIGTHARAAKNKAAFIRDNPGSDQVSRVAGEVVGHADSIASANDRALKAGNKITMELPNVKDKTNWLGIALIAGLGIAAPLAIFAFTKGTLPGILGSALGWVLGLFGKGKK